MGTRGPAPKPTALRILQGNPGKVKLNRREPQPAAAAALLEAPAWLDPTAREAFLRLRADLPWLTVADVYLFCAYCVAFARWRAAEEAISDGGFVVKFKDEKGITKYAQQRPEVSIAKAYFHQMIEAGRQLGLSPAARTRIQTEPESPKEDGNDKRLFG